MSQDPAPNESIGVSLTQDAWRTLRRNRPAMVALWALVLVVVSAFFTPLLPLQPPDRDQTKNLFAPPTLWSTPAPVAGAGEGEELAQSFLLQETFRFEAGLPAELAPRIAEARERLASERAALRRIEEERDRVARLGEAFERLEEVESGDDPPVGELVAEIADDGAATLEELNERVEEALVAVRTARAAVDSLVQRAYADAGFPRLDPLARAMVQTRYAIFGEWEIVSLCGRDKLGRDILSRIFWGARVSLIVGVVATLVSLVIGVTYGAVSGYAGGWIDNLMMRVVDVLYSIPFVFLVIFIISVLSEDETKEWLAGYGIDRITIFYFLVGAIYWLTMSRVVRGQVVSLRNEQYVEAAEALGVSQTAIVFRHLVPNLFSIVLVYLTLTIPRVILFEAFLSFLGLGVEPPDVSWGLLANEGIQVITPVRTYWWLVVFPSLAIGTTLFSLNFLGDGLRDAFDPRMKGR